MVVRRPGVALFIGTAYGLIFLLVTQLSKPTVRSVNEIDAANIQSWKILVINRPDGGPDISGGGKAFFPIPTPDYEAVLAPLRNAKLIQTDRGIYLGEIRLLFKDGKKLTIMLHRVGDGPNPPPMLRISVEQYQYDAGPLDAFLKPLIEVEARARKGS